MKKQLALVLYMVLAVVSAALLVMTIMASAGAAVWGGMVTVAVLSLLGLAIAVSVVAFNPRKNVYSIGFYVLHIGIVMFLIGTFGYFANGYSIMVGVPNGGSVTPTLEYQMINQMGLSAADINDLKGYYNQIPGPTDENGNATTEDLGFNLRITDFKTEYYDAEQKNVKHFEATIEFLDDYGKVETKALTVNHPIRYGDWKLYLMDVGVNEVYGFQEVRVMFKRDSTEFLSTSGIILTILGTFMMCFIKPREKVEQPAAQGAPGKNGTQKGSQQKSSQLNGSQQKGSQKKKKGGRKR